MLKSKEVEMKPRLTDRQRTDDNSNCFMENLPDQFSERVLNVALSSCTLDAHQLVQLGDGEES